MRDLATKKNLYHPRLTLHCHGCSIFAVQYVVVSNFFSFNNIEIGDVIACYINACQSCDVFSFIWCQGVHRTKFFFVPILFHPHFRLPGLHSRHSSKYCLEDICISHTASLGCGKSPALSLHSNLLPVRTLNLVIV